ncbi:MAG TPA: glycosyltransferase family protein [Thermoanaerobaculia bacterium]|nr:glycosyltransferase family protein [Thermoanaerobaculia bacterium]
MAAPSRVVAILQARTGSTRFPRKVLAGLCGEPMLAVIIERLRPATLVDELVVATTTEAEDDPVVALAEQMGVASFRGSRDDCLDRYYRAAKSFEATVVARLTADNPVVDGGFVDTLVQAFFAADPPCHYLAPGPGFPVGMSCEILSFDALEAAWREDADPASREHVTQFVRRRADRFSVAVAPAERDDSQIRWTVDHPEDLERVRALFADLGTLTFDWRRALSFATEPGPVRGG